jgi:flavin reductase (DIM6/NTAB) family NADH-FMN oxidoreductase RutF
LSQARSPYLTEAAADSAVGLVTSAAQGRLNVMTASFFAESSHLPVLLRVAVAPASLTHELISASGWFGLSVLCQGQETLALDCGSVSGRDVPKLEKLRVSYQVTENGVPLLNDTLTTSECKVVSVLPLPDHALFIGEVTRSFTQSRLSYRDPLLISGLRAYLAGA